MPSPEPSPDTIDAFVARWETAGASERANYQLFLTELCDLLGVPRPEPATPEAARNTYIFERAVSRRDKDGHATTVYLDLYKAGHFVLETKQGVSGAAGGPVATRTGHGRRGTKTWDKALDKAYHQARAYIRDLPSEEGRPPFLIVCDVGHVIELYAEFTGTGGQYLRFPDPQNHRIYLEDLRGPDTRKLLRDVWLDPFSLDPSNRSAKVTREIADAFAQLASSLESSGHHPETVALFLQRCLFTLFAEDVGLLPNDGFQNMLRLIQDKPQGFVVMAGRLWQEMATGSEFSSVVMEEIAHFNGGLFDEPSALPLDVEQVGLLLHAARQDWTEVEPAIFGTLLERALDPRERRKMGAHYTPRAYVDRLVDATMMQDLRDQWGAVKAAAAQHHDLGMDAKARQEIETFHRGLCKTRVLDPACGSGNFLYVALARMKELEAEVLDLLEELGGNRILEMNDFKVRPNQFFGLEINEHAVAVAQLVLWIGYFQWHQRTTGRADTNDRPLLPKQATIVLQDAVLAFDEKLPRRGKNGSHITIWDGRTTKPHPVTGKEIPDETATTLLYDFTNPHKSEWPGADYIVGNPPFVGDKVMKQTLGDGYTTALRDAYPRIPKSADFVAYWWDRAAECVAAGATRRFGFIATNSLSNKFNRRVLARHVGADPGVHLEYVIPDHPWVDSADGADVRVSMTVGAQGSGAGTLARVIEERSGDFGEKQVALAFSNGVISTALTIGADLTSVVSLRANELVACPGAKLMGQGFLLNTVEANALIEADGPVAESVIRPYLAAREVAQQAKGRLVIDLLGWDEEAVRHRLPNIYQWLSDRVRPGREKNNRPSYRKYWWLFGEPRKTFRKALAGIGRQIITPETGKHRYFCFEPIRTLAEGTLVVIASDDAFHLGVLNSTVHCRWALRAGSRLGVGNDPRYNKTQCFDPFPFPDLPDGSAPKEAIRRLGEQLDEHRKTQKSQHKELRMTGIYNVLEKLRADEPLTDKDKAVHEQALVTLLMQIHDELDAAVLRAYGWEDLEGAIPLADRIARGDTDLEQELLKRLVELNHARAAEEDQGNVRYLRPEFQDPDFGKKTRPVGTQSELPTARPSQPPKKGAKLTWPKDLPSQVAAIQKLLVNRGPDAALLSAAFGRKSKKREQQVAQILQTLESLGQL